MWMLVLALLAQVQSGDCAAPTTPEGPPALVVQVVDQLWLPIPGALVRVIPSAGAGEKKETRTGREGYAQFWLPPDGEYAVEALLENFKGKRVKGVRIWKRPETPPTAYVQLQLVFSGPKVTVE